MAEKKDPYEAKDTGHEWDGIRELRNDPPGWWMMGGYISIIFLIVYFVLYPAIPLVHGYTRGLLGWTQVDEYKSSVAEIMSVRAPFEEKIAKKNAKEILADPQLSQFALASSKAIFGDKCAPCHGSGGQGGPGFPTLADDDWVYGGTIESITESITAGRQGMMPAYKSTLSPQEVNDLVTYISGLNTGAVHEPGKSVFLGQTAGQADCVTCHGEDAKGNPDVGGVNLADKIWRFESSQEGIKRTILHGVNQEDDKETRKALMPTFGGKLSEGQIKQLAVKVFMFGGGKKG